MASTYLTRTFQSGGNRKKWTMSMWVKRSGLGSDQKLFQTYVSTYTHSPFDSSDRFQFQDGNGGNKVTSMKFRDTSAWYHIVIAIDTDLATADDRYKIYVNGERITAFDTSTNPSQGYEGEWNKAQLMNIGRHSAGTGYFDGLMSHINFCDGYQYQASDFGETDATTGEWKIKTSPSVSYGTTGFFILKDGNTVTDSSSNSNTWTANGTLTKTEDCPSNVFATISNILGSDQIGSTVSFSNGNTVAEDPNGSASGINPSFISTLGMPSKGKWYCEVQPSSFSTGSGHSIGIFRSKGNIRPSSFSSDKIRYIFADTAYYIIKYGSNDQTGLTSVSAGQTVGLALDLDNGTFQYYVNGSARANQLTGINSANDGYDYFFLMDLESSSSGRYGKCSFNFGNGAFGSTQLTGTTYQDSNGQGIFKYQPPTNFLALCTKNLNV